MPSRPPGTLRLLLRPSMFVLHVPAVLAVVAAVLLGNWQLDAWQEQREARAVDLADADPVPLADVMGPDDPFPGDAVGRPVTVAGTWLPESAAYVSGKDHAGQAGYWAVALLTTCGDTADGCAEPAALPVVLGWSARASAPAPGDGDGGDLTGWLQPGEAAGEPDPDPGDRVLTSLRIAELLQDADRDLYGAYLILEEPAAVRGALEPVTPDSLPDPPASTALRNFLYGVEWFVFAAFAVFLWWRWSRDEVQRARGGPAADDGVSPVSEDGEGEPAPPEARLPSRP